MILEYIEIVHSGDDVDLQTFVTNNYVSLTAEFDLDQFFNYNGNSDRIRDSLRVEESSTSSADAIIKSGTLLRVPKDNVEREYLSLAGNTVVPNDDFEAFLDSKVREIITDTDYSPVNIEIPTDIGKTFRFVNDFSVWIWCKALGAGNASGRMINVTPFIESLTTNVGSNGGNFNIKFSPVIGEIKKDGGGQWIIDKSTIDQFIYNDRSNIVSRSSDSTYRKSINNDEHFIQPTFLLNNIIQSNDVVFIKFEPLKSEYAKRLTDLGDFSLDSLYIDPYKLVSSDIPGGQQLFDMIALVDSNNITRNSESANTTIQVTGRDLMKLLLEDGEYFFPTDIAGITGGIQTDNSGRSINRLVNGDFNFFNAYIDRSIDFSMRFIFNMLANIKICDNELFSCYGDDRTFWYDYRKVLDNNGETSVLDKTPVEGIWQIIKLVIDPKISDRRIVDSSIVSDQGSLKSFIDGKVVQSPFAEFYGDTYGNQFYFMVRKPPYNGESYRSNAKIALSIEEDDIYSENLTWSDEEVYSWYRIIPRGNIFGDDNSLALTYFPAVYFSEYADLWGSRPLQIVTNYISFPGFRGTENKESLNYLIDQSYEDLSFVIQSNAYLPFSRKGTITIKGDRRMKRGNMVFHKGTGEYFMIDSVMNTTNVNGSATDRVTELHVIRGLKKAFVEGREVEIQGAQGTPITKRVSYFDIITIQDDPSLNGKKTFKLDRDVFNFFVRRMQVETRSMDKVTTSY